MGLGKRPRRDSPRKQRAPAAEWWTLGAHGPRFALRLKRRLDALGYRARVLSRPVPGAPRRFVQVERLRGETLEAWFDRLWQGLAQTSSEDDPFAVAVHDLHMEWPGVQVWSGEFGDFEGEGGLSVRLRAGGIEWTGSCTGPGNRITVSVHWEEAEPARRALYGVDDPSEAGRWRTPYHNANSAGFPSPRDLAALEHVLAPTGLEVRRVPLPALDDPCEMLQVAGAPTDVLGFVQDVTARIPEHEAFDVIRNWIRSLPPRILLDKSNWARALAVLQHRPFTTAGVVTFLAGDKIRDLCLLETPVTQVDAALAVLAPHEAWGQTDTA